MRRIFCLSFALLFASTMVANAEVKVEKVDYKGWHKCYRVSNGEVELIVTGDVGPRIIRFGFIGGQDPFQKIPGQAGQSRPENYQPPGGDRVWQKPEDGKANPARDNMQREITP